MADDLRALAMAATPGPWWVDDSNNVVGPDGDSVAVTFGNLATLPEPTTDHDNAGFIAAANPQAILALLDRAEAAEVEWRQMSVVAADLLDRAEAAERERDAARKAMVEAALPLEVIAAQHRLNPYRELSPDFIEEINSAIAKIRVALGPPAPEKP